MAKTESTQPLLLPEHGHVQPFTRRWETRLSEEPPGSSEWQHFTRIFGVQLRDFLLTGGVKDCPRDSPWRGRPLLKPLEYVLHWYFLSSAGFYKNNQQHVLISRY